jgi:predicted nucleic-acid-binding Zn-ribbon protein
MVSWLDKICGNYSRCRICEEVIDYWDSICFKCKCIDFFPRRECLRNAKISKLCDIFNNEYQHIGDKKEIQLYRDALYEKIVENDENKGKNKIELLKRELWK